MEQYLTRIGRGAMCLDTGRGKTCNTDTRIFVSGRIEGYKGIRTDNLNKLNLRGVRRTYMYKIISILKRDTELSANHSTTR